MTEDSEHPASEVLLIGGPMDGNSVQVDLDAEELTVSMMDLTRHTYRAEILPQEHSARRRFIYEGRT